MEKIELDDEDLETAKYIAASETKSTIVNKHYDLLCTDKEYLSNCYSTEEDIIKDILGKYEDEIYKTTKEYIENGWPILWKECNELIIETIKQYIKTNK